MKIKFNFFKLEAMASWNTLCDFFITAKPGDSLYFEEGLIDVESDDAPSWFNTNESYLVFIVRTAEGYLSLLHAGDGCFIWRKSSAPPIDLVESERMAPEDVIGEMVSSMRVQDVYNSFWCLINEYDEILPNLYRILIYRKHFWNFRWGDGCFRSPLRVWSKGGEFTEFLGNVELIGWHKGQLYALDLEKGLFALGFYERSFLS